METYPYTTDDKESLRAYRTELDKSYSEKQREAARRWRNKKSIEERQAYDRAKYLRKKELYNERSRQWAKDNPFYMQAASIQSRIKNKYLTKYTEGDIKDTIELAQWIRERKGQLCVYCKVNESDSVDHIVPISTVGTHTWDNICMACSICNKMKLDHYLADWLDHMRAILKNYSNELSP